MTPVSAAAAKLGNIYWLASYPKSGNTWMRVLLTNYLREEDEPADINALGGGPIASARELFDDYVGIEASDLTQDEIEAYRPRLYEQLSASAEEPLILKVHDAFTVTASGEPLISRSATAGALYLIRNPLDVACSLAHHSNSTIDWAIETMANPRFAFVSNPHRLHIQLRQKLLTWSQHVTSWVDDSCVPVLVIRYEDMQADTRASLAQVIRFFSLDFDHQRIDKAVEFSSFERLQQQEQATGFGEKAPGASSFFRKGVAGSWREQLTAAQVDRIVSDHHHVMARFDYLAPDGQPAYWTTGATA